MNLFLDATAAGEARDSGRDTFLPLSEGDLRAFVTHSAVPFALLTTEGQVIGANQAALELIGLPANEYLGREIAPYFVDRSALDDLLERFARGEAVRELELSLRSEDGCVKDVLLDSLPLSRDGTVAHLCSLRDVSTRRETEEAASRLVAVVESSHDAIVAKDLDGIIQSWNAGAERLFGYSAEEIVGRSIRTIIPQDRQSEEDEVLRRIRAGEVVDHFETIRQRKDGTLVPISLTISPVKDRRGRIIGASKIARDISEQRAAEEAMHRSLALKDQFLGLVSHELRTPISTIVGNAQLLQRRGDRLDEASRAQALGDLVSEGERLQRIVENLLLLTRLEATAELAREGFDARHAVEGAVEAARRRAPLREISFEGPPEAVPVTGDPTLTALVVQNFISNAEKYSPLEAGIDVELRRLDREFVQICVLDRGIGIAPEDIARVFQPFYRAESGRERAPGMGLGLAVSQRIVEAQGGSIAVEAREGGGSAFWFTLPVADQPIH